MSQSAAQSPPRRTSASQESPDPTGSAFLNGDCNPFMRDLTALHNILQSSTDAYWEKAAELLCNYTQAQAVSIWLFPIPDRYPEVRVRVGRWPRKLRAQVERWEAHLQSTVLEQAQRRRPRDRTAASASPLSEPPLFHVRLVADGLIQGGVSLLFPDKAYPAPAEHAPLEQLVNIVLDSGIRSRQLLLVHYRLDRISFIVQVGQALNSTLDLASVLAETTETAASILNAEAATLFLADERRNELIFYVPTGSAGGLLRERRIPYGRGIAGWVATHREALVVNDVTQDPRFFKAMDAVTGFVTRSILCVPLETPSRLVGVLEVLNKRDPQGFSEEDLSWLDTLGHQAAIALENARLYESLRQEQERIIRAQEETRRQIARDLHDGPAQILSLILMNLDMARNFLAKGRMDTVQVEIDLLEQLARQAKDEIRTLLFELRPLILENKDLVSALRAYEQQLNKTLAPQELEIVFELEELPWEPSSQAANQIFSVIQEAISNVRKHAQASHLWVRLWSDRTRLYFQIEDDGHGFDTEKTRAASHEQGSFGLVNMFERLELIGGKLSFQSPSPNTGKGTLVSGEAPWEAILAQDDS